MTRKRGEFDFVIWFADGARIQWKSRRPQTDADIAAAIRRYLLPVMERLEAPIAVKEEHKLRAARRLVEEVLAGWVGGLPFAGSRLEAVRQELGELGGDYQPNDPLWKCAEERAALTEPQP